MITTKNVNGNGHEEKQPRAQLVRKDGTTIDYGEVNLGQKTITRAEIIEYRYDGERDGIYRIFREQ